MKRFSFFTFCLLFVVTACGQKAPALPNPFDYNPKVPFDTKIISQSEQDGVTVTQLSYTAHDPSFAVNMGGRTVATLVNPKGSGPFAGIVSVFSLAANPSDRQEYINEAIRLAQHGAVSLIPVVYFLSSFTPTVTQADRPLIIGQVIELRRAFDFLLAQPGVDPQRLGFVGHAEGATYGGVLAGADKHAKAYILVGGWPSFANLICAYWSTYCSVPPKTSIDTILTYVKDIDPTSLVAQAAPASLFFQFGKNDAGVTESLANQLYAAASQPKKIEWYDDSSLMSTGPVVKARQVWLIDQLKLAP
jgi:fermentation-respiration switch protein FrsA (DUF1100 family)